MPPMRRLDSDTTHVSDSEPEREAARLVRARKIPTSRTRSDRRHCACTTIQEIRLAAKNRVEELPDF
jgi:hypothetical protein